jgi:NADP-dependent 3-hydroxy acid dehydrogenase YdfG
MVCPNYGVYPATKAAVAHLTHGLRADAIAYAAAAATRMNVAELIIVPTRQG